MQLCISAAPACPNPAVLAAGSIMTFLQQMENSNKLVAYVRMFCQKVRVNLAALSVYLSVGTVLLAWDMPAHQQRRFPLVGSNKHLLAAVIAEWYT